MKKIIFLSFLPFVLLYFSTQAQQIIYSQVDKDDAVTGLHYEIIGKINGNILVFKNYSFARVVAVYDRDMKLIDKTNLDFLPPNVSTMDFINYQDYFVMVYQFRYKNIVYCMAARLDGKGKLLSDAVVLDSTQVSNGSTANKIYSAVHSENKQKIMMFKINTKDGNENVVTTVLTDNVLNIIHKSVVTIQMPEKNDFLTEFQVDNQGDAAFLRAWGTGQNDNISQVILLSKSALSDAVKSTDLKLPDIYLDDIRLKVDNENNHYLVTSFYSYKKRGNIDGLYLSLWDKLTAKTIYTVTPVLSEELRGDAKGDNSMKTAFNDYFLKNIFMKSDGGYTISAESNYTSSRNTPYYNRWDYMYGNPYITPGYSAFGSPFYNPAGRYNNYVQTRYYADNIAVLSFDEKGKMEWSNVIHKSQFDDNTDNFLSYGLINTGDQIHYLFNVQSRRQTIFTDQMISPEGQLTTNPTMRGLDKGYEFMPRHAKQVGAREIIVPCQSRNSVCFAKVNL